MGKKGLILLVLIALLAGTILIVRAQRRYERELEHRLYRAIGPLWRAVERLRAEADESHND